MATTLEQGGDAYLVKLKQQQLPEGFWMYSYKVVPCPYTYRHNWTHCPFAHSGETARRRDPTVCVHAAELCTRVRSNKPCSDGDSCPFAHNLFEQYLHPTRYRTRLCYFGERCNRSTCFFAHNISELRAAPGEGGPPPQPYHATAAELAAAIPAPQQLPPDHLHNLVSLQQRPAHQLGSISNQSPALLIPNGLAVAGGSNGGGVRTGSGTHVPQIQAMPSLAPSELARQHYGMMVGISPPEQLDLSNRHSTSNTGRLPHLHSSCSSSGTQGLHGGPQGIAAANVRGLPPQHMLVQGHTVGRDQQQQQHAYSGAHVYAPYEPTQQQQMVPLSGGMVTRYQQQQVQLQRQHAMDRDPGNRLQGWAASVNAEYQLACRGKATPFHQQRQQQQQPAYGHSLVAYSNAGPPPPPHSFHSQHHHHVQQHQQQQQAMYESARGSTGSYSDIAGGGRMEAEAQWQLQQQLHYQQQQVLTQQHQQQRQQYSHTGADAYSAQHFSQPMPNHHQQQHHRAPKVMIAADNTSNNNTFPEQVAAAVVAAVQHQTQILEAIPVTSTLSSAASVSSAQQLQQQQSLPLSSASSLSALQPGLGSRQDLLQKQLAMDGLDNAAEEAHYHARRYVSLSGNTYLSMPSDYDGGLGFSGGLRPRVLADEQQRLRGSSYSGACYGSDIPLVPTGSEHLLPEFAAASAAVMTRGLDVHQRADMLAAALAGSSPSALVEALQQQEVVRRASEANVFPVSSMGSGRMSYSGIGEGHAMGVHTPSVNPYTLNTSNSMALQQQPLTQSWQQQQLQQQQAPDGALGPGGEMSESLLQMLLGLGLGPYDKESSMLPSRHSDPGQLQDCSMLTHNSLSMDYDQTLYTNRISDPSGGSVPASVDPMLAELILALQNITGSGSFAQQQYQDDSGTRHGDVDFANYQEQSSSTVSRISSSGTTTAASIGPPASCLELQQYDGALQAGSREVGRANNGEAGMFRGSHFTLAVAGAVESSVVGSSGAGIVEGCAEVPDFLQRSGSSSTDAGISNGGAEAPSPLLRTVSGAAMSAKLDAFVRHTLLPQLRDAGLAGSLADGSGAAVANQPGDIAIAIGKLLQQLLPNRGATSAAAAAVGAVTATDGASGDVSSESLERGFSGSVEIGSNQ